ncbi:peptidoglycan -binding protein [Tahibacter amnicola]|uniref:Peptidoglycan -binding protein n=1 Tax=Tahibacter amnicola TaxID=2976241 RepID=A0ABY6BLR8_9GAMM|nr:peptidoglycan -binding protein [Tahibacter amnicola]UXI68757.1 peptidoglycan -binding protein [Tahibacter amnicola]
MRSLATRRRGLDIWPGFVDALTSLIMVMMFVLLLFAIGQFVLSDSLAGKNRALDSLNARVAELARTLSLAESAKTALDAQVKELSASLGATAAERDQFKTSLDAAQTEAARLGADVAALQKLKAELETEVAKLAGELGISQEETAKGKELSAQQVAQIELLNRQLAAVNTQLAQIQAALDVARKDITAKDLKIANLGKELNIALANRVGELERYRSEFFGRLREALGNRADVRIVGDRFVVPTDILFDSGSAELSPAALASMATLAMTVREVASEIPSTVDWVLRIDGHTDDRPIHTDRFPSNWELSSARAVSIVKYLVVQGLPAHRLSANGFGQFQPLDTSQTPEALARNRRIEIQLTNR